MRTAGFFVVVACIFYGTPYAQETDEETVLQAEQEQVETDRLRYNLEQQFKKLRKTIEEEDAFSLALAEDYFSYGLLLRDSGRYDEAIEVLIDALHILKVNHGIYSMEQRPVLKVLFDIHYDRGDTEDFEDYLGRILWIETKNTEINDEFSYHLLIEVGNRYLDEFLRTPTAGQRSIETLLRAKNHLRSALRLYEDKPLSQILLPYGELSLISVLGGRLYSDVDKTSSLEDPRIKRSRDLQGRELALFSYFEHSFSDGVGVLKRYLKKAKAEESITHQIRALIGLGDLHQLFKRFLPARDYYQAAFELASLHSDGDGMEYIESFKRPLPLPSFLYSIERDAVLPDRPTTLIPLKLMVDARGQVTSVKYSEQSSDEKRFFIKARRQAKKLVFRPALIDGEFQPWPEFVYQQRVYSGRARHKYGSKEFTHY